MMCVSRIASRLVIRDAFVKTGSGQSNIIGLIATSQYVDVNLHISSSFDKLRMRRF